MWCCARGWNKSVRTIWLCHCLSEYLLLLTFSGMGHLIKKISLEHERSNQYKVAYAKCHIRGLVGSLGFRKESNL